MAAKLRFILSAFMAIRLNSLSLRKEILDQVPPFVDVRIKLDRRGTPWMLRDDDLRPSFVQVVDDRLSPGWDRLPE